MNRATGIIIGLAMMILALMLVHHDAGMRKLRGIEADNDSKDGDIRDLTDARDKLRVELHAAQKHNFRH